MDKTDGNLAHPCTAVIDWVKDRGVDGTHELVPVRCCDVVASLREDLHLVRSVLSSVTVPRVKNGSAPDNIARVTAETLVNEKERVEQEAESLFLEEREVGEASWYNQLASTRQAYRDRVKARESL